MTLLQITYFVTLANSDTMTEAAEKLYISQPALSTAVRNLERDLQTNLFDRVGRELRLNAQGELFLDCATHILNDLADVKARLNEQNRQRSDTIFISAEPLDIGTEAIARYARLRPAVDIQCVQTDTRSSVDRLLKGRIIGFLSLEPCRVSGVTSEQLLNEPLWLMVNRHNPISRQTSVGIQQLNGETLVGMRRGMPFRDYVDKLLLAHNVFPGRITEESTQEALGFKANSNVGIGLIPESGARSQLRREGPALLNNVVYLPVREASFRRTAYLNTAEGKRTGAQSRTRTEAEAEAFLDFLRRFCKKIDEYGHYPPVEDVTAST